MDYHHKGETFSGWLLTGSLRQETKNRPCFEDFHHDTSF